MSDKEEGKPGTWSYCGINYPHGSHPHTIIFNEGPYTNVLCLGATQEELDEVGR